MTIGTVEVTKRMIAAQRTRATRVQRVAFKTVRGHTHPALIDVTGRTRRRVMPPAQRPSREIVIEACQAPAIRPMAQLTLRAHPAGMWIEMTTGALANRRCVARGVTLTALESDVTSGEPKAGEIVIKGHATG